MGKVMGKYCKAYLLKDLRKFNGWNENAENARLEKQLVDGEEVEIARVLNDDSIVYLQENHVVTDGVFKEENVIFSSINNEWKEFCHSDLEFKIPDYANPLMQNDQVNADNGENVTKH